jgi:hypothetical protein
MSPQTLLEVYAAMFVDVASGPSNDDSRRAVKLEILHAELLNRMTQ